MPRYRLGSVVVVAVFAALFMARSAMAADVNDIFNDYQKNGSINACKYSPGDLQRAGGQLPSDVEQYSPSFSDQLNQARGQQCGGGGSGQSVPAGAPVSGGGGGGGGAGGGASPGKVSAPPTPAASKRASLEDVPAPAVSTAAARSGTSAGKPDSLPVLILAIAALVFVVALVARRLSVRRSKKIGGPSRPHPAPSGR